MIDVTALNDQPERVECKEQGNDANSLKDCIAYNYKLHSDCRLDYKALSDEVKRAFKIE